MKIINKTTNLDEMGGKGYQLSLLNEFCTVPEFFVLLFDSLEEIDDKVVQNKILKVFDNHNFCLVAVRSSATKEDSLSSSFAGMFETTLNVTRNNLIKEIKNIMLSYHTGRVQKYCSLNDIEEESVQMRIVIQKMVDSRISGVCFSKDNKDNNNLIIEACFGIGEAVVSGTVSPDLYVVNRDNFDIIKSKINYQSKTLKLKKDNEEYERLPLYKRYVKKMTDEEIIRLAKQVLEIEQNLNFKAADVEWAYEDNKLYILQARQFTGVL